MFAPPDQWVLLLRTFIHHDCGCVSGREQCKVLFPYEAQNEDELTLKEGEIINIITKVRSVDLCGCLSLNKLIQLLNRPRPGLCRRRLVDGGVWRKARRFPRQLCEADRS